MARRRLRYLSDAWMAVSFLAAAASLPSHHIDVLCYWTFCQLPLVRLEVFLAGRRCEGQAYVRTGT